MLIWAGVLAGGAYGLSQLKQDFDPDWFLPDDSNARVYGGINDKVFLLVNMTFDISLYFLKKNISSST